MAKSIKHMVQAPAHLADGEVIQPGTYYDSEGDVPEGVRTVEVIVDDKAAEPGFSVPEPSAPAVVQAQPPGAAPAPATEDKPAAHRSGAAQQRGGRA